MRQNEVERLGEIREGIEKMRRAQEDCKRYEDLANDCALREQTLREIMDQRRQQAKDSIDDVFAHVQEFDTEECQEFDQCNPAPTVPYLGQCLDTAKQVITGERQDSYGNPEDSFKIIAGYWSVFLTARLGVDVQLTALDSANMMVLFKQARKLGQVPCYDNYLDSCGYEAIAADKLLGVEL